MKEQFYEIRPFPNHEDRYGEFIKNNFVAIGWPEILDISNLSFEEIKAEIKKLHPDYDPTKSGQIAGFFTKLLNIKIGDIILIPYFDNEGPIVTIAKVTKPYYYDKNYYEKHMAHQLGIERITDISRSEILNHYKKLNNSLNARLTLTKINTRSHEKALNYIKKVIKSTTNNSATMLNKIDTTNNISKSSEQLIEEYHENLNTIKNKINKFDDDLVVRSLIFSALTLRETLLNSFIKKKIISEIGSEEYDLSNILINRLHDSQFREKLRKLYFKNAKLDDKYQKLRNAMAHNINSTKLINKTEILNKQLTEKGNLSPSIPIDEIFDELIAFSNKF